MRYYLDTNIVIFVLGGNADELSSDTLHLLDDSENTFYISVIVLKELYRLYKDGDLRQLKFKSYKDLYSAIKTLHYEIAPLKVEHINTYAELFPADGHKDPYDHLIIAQSISDRIPVISSDKKFKLYESQGLDFIFNKR